MQDWIAKNFKYLREDVGFLNESKRQSDFEETSEMSTQQIEKVFYRRLAISSVSYDTVIISDHL